MKLFKCFILFFTLIIPVFAQADCRFCNAIAKNNFKKAGRIFKHQVKLRQNGTAYFNGPGSGMQITHQYNIDTLTQWLNSQTCITDAMSDKCQMKTDGYPGHTTIGFKLVTKVGAIEKCFLLQEGTTGQINFFGWRPHLFISTNKLIYKGIVDCPGFVYQQKINCREMLK